MSKGNSPKHRTPDNSLIMRGLSSWTMESPDSVRVKIVPRTGSLCSARKDKVSSAWLMQPSVFFITRSVGMGVLCRTSAVVVDLEMGTMMPPLPSTKTMSNCLVRAE